MTLASLKAQLIDEARRLGFAAVGVAPAGENAEAAAHLEAWLAEGMEGQMGWMAERLHHRRSPQGLWPETQSVIALAMSYAPLGDPLALADAPAQDRCGSCRACQDACPTGAFPAPYRLDARRCISYLTIEHKGAIPEEFRAALGNRIYGCDDCLAVCPWNKFADAAARNQAFLPRAELVAPRLAELLGLDDVGFRALFSGSPIKRIGRDRFIRNCLYAAGNSGTAALIAPVAALCEDADPVVAEAARWALTRLDQGRD